MRQTSIPSSNDANLPEPQHSASIATLSDEELKAAGLVKISAFVHSPASKNAKRASRARAKAQNQGFGQVNLLMPSQHHTALKELAIALRAGTPIQEALQSAFSAELANAKLDTQAPAIKPSKSATGVPSSTMVASKAPGNGINKQPSNWIAALACALRQVTNWLRGMASFH